MDESIPGKRFKSSNMINRATSISETTLNISEQIVGFKIPDKPTVNHSFHDFTDATSQRNRTIIGRIFGSLPGFGIGMINAFLQSEEKSRYSKIFKSNKREDFGKYFRS